MEGFADTQIGNRKSRPRGRVVAFERPERPTGSRDPDPASEVAVVRSVLIAQAAHPKPLSTNRPPRRETENRI